MSMPDEGLRIVRTRVYYDATTGEIVHVHRLAAAADEPLDERRMDEEMAVFEGTLAQRHDRPLEHIAVDDDAVQQAVAPDVNFRVDVRTRQLVRTD